MTIKVGYGVVLGEKENYRPFYLEPLGEDEYDENEPDFDFEEWWFNIACGYQPLYELYDKDGNHIVGQQQIDEYYAHQQKFINEHPCPVELQYHFNWDYPTYVLYWKSTIVQSYDYPLEFNKNPDVFNFTDGTGIQHFKDFLEKYKITYEGEPGWIVSALYD